MPGAVDHVTPAPLASLSWVGIVRLGLVQTSLGAIFVLSTSTLNRVMVVELALPAVLPGLLIGLHYAMQVLRPRLGYGSDVGGRRTPWIIGGMAVLAFGGLLAAVATGLMKAHLIAGIALAIPAFILIGLGVGASGTALLVLIAKRTAPHRRAAAATIAWVMMIVGFIVTAGVAGRLLDPFSPERLIAVAAGIALTGFVVSSLAVWGLEGAASSRRDTPGATGAEGSFRAALREVWADAPARRFAIFIFVSMLAYGGEELMIEPFAGALFGMTPGQTAKLSGLLHAGSLAGMILVAIAGTALHRTRIGSLRGWMVGGCLASGVALVGLALAGLLQSGGAIRPLLFALGLANGAYAIAAIGSMMQRIGATSSGTKPSAAAVSGEGLRMGLWGAAQALAFGGGGLAATALSDISRGLLPSQPTAYAIVFLVQALVFLASACLAANLDGTQTAAARRSTASVPG